MATLRLELEDGTLLSHEATISIIQFAGLHIACTKYGQSIEDFEVRQLDDDLVEATCAACGKRQKFSPYPPLF